MFRDTRVIARAGAHEILTDRQDVIFVDGTRARLHEVDRAGVPQTMLRAVEAGNGGFWLVDLGRLLPALDSDLRTCHERDRVGFVLHHLRQAYPTRRDFMNALGGRILAYVVTDTATA